MSRKLLIPFGAGMILVLIGLVMVFGAALAQPLAQANGSLMGVQAEGTGSCHTDGGMMDGATEHMLGPLAKALGMSAADVSASLTGGKSLNDLAAARGFSQEALVAALTGAMREVMQQHVQDGLLTQAEVDQMLEHMGPAHLTEMVDGQMSGMMGEEQHGSMMKGQGHAGMMGGQDHGGMMGGSTTPNIMGGASAGEDEDSSSCHFDGLVGESV